MFDRKIGVFEVCGNDFSMRSPNSKYCSKACSKKAKNMDRGGGWKIYPMTDNMKKISIIAGEAAKHGMSYGKYVSQKGL